MSSTTGVPMESRTPTLLEDASSRSKPSTKGVDSDVNVKPIPLSTSNTLVDEPQETSALAQVSTLRKLSLLSIFTLAEFLDAFNNSALFPAIPSIISDLEFRPAETVWIISAYQLTFAAFLLVSGRISDVYTPKPAFIAGSFILGVTHLIGGFMTNKIALVVLRALGGIGGALTIPSALSLIVQLFPDPAHQARAIALFGSSGAIGNVLGVIIGAVLVQYTNWSWIFWFVAIIGIGIAAVCLFLIPSVARPERERKVNFDVAGVSLLTVAVILFIFAVTSGSTQGWDTAYVLAPLVISLAILMVFLWWEARIDSDDAVLPPRMWRYRNFSVLIGLALLPYFWWVTSFVSFTEWWETVFGWSAINTAVHFLPMGIGAGAISFVAGGLPRYFPHKYIILAGAVLTLIASIMLPFANSPSTYWPIVFPAFTVGTIGCMIIYANSSIAIFAYTPPSVAGTVGAVFNCALQLGSAVGLAAVTSIQTSVKSGPVLKDMTKSQWRSAFEGKSASFWFLTAIVAVEVVSILLFFRVDHVEHHEEEQPRIKRVDEEAVLEKTQA